MIEPRHWQATIDMLRKEPGFVTGALSLFVPLGGKMLLMATSGIKPKWLAKLETHADDTTQIWGRPARLLEYPLDEPVVLSWAVGRHTFQGNPFYEEWGKPLGLSDLSLRLVHDPTA